MQLSRDSYQPINGGKLNVKKLFKKGKRGLKKGNQFYDQNSQLINMVAPPEVQQQLAKARKISVQADELTGGKFKLKKFAHKLKKVAKIAAPIVSMVNPEVGAALQTGIMLSGGGRAHNGGVRGGSFKTHGGGANMSAGSHQCSQCGAVSKAPKIKSLQDRNYQ